MNKDRNKNKNNGGSKQSKDNLVDTAKTKYVCKYKEKEVRQRYSGIRQRI